MLVNQLMLEQNLKLDAVNETEREKYVLIAATLIQEIQITTIHTDCLLQKEMFVIYG